MKFHWRNLAASNLAVVFMFKILQYIKCRKPKENEDDNEQTVKKVFVSVCFNLFLCIHGLPWPLSGGFVAPYPFLMPDIRYS